MIDKPRLSSIFMVIAMAVLLIATRPAHGQSESILYSFCSAGIGCPDGQDSQASLVEDSAGNLYGTTMTGGIGSAYGYGTVFELSPDGNGGWTETVLHAFGDGSDGIWPVAPLIMDGSGNLYGTAQVGGTYNYGVVFRLSPAGNGWTETVLYNFTGGLDGESPAGGLIMDPQGNLYGMSLGCPFELSPSGNNWTFQTISTACGGTRASLTRDIAGNIFGVTSFSEVFESSPNGSGGWNTTVIHKFTGSPGDGYYPDGTLVFDKAGNLYGTTSSGGAYNTGTVFKLTPKSGGVWSEQILHSFGGPVSDGESPWAGVVLDAAGNIYGTTPFSRRQYTGGTVFELVPQVDGTYKEKILWTFNFTNGNEPFGGVILNSAGDLFGTTESYGPSSGGVAYRLNMHVAPTRTTLLSSLNPSFYGQTVVLTATAISRLGPPPDGETVTFMAGPSTLGTATLSGGSATFTTSTLAAGHFPLTAVYYGDAQLNVSKSPQLIQDVAKSVSTTTVVSSLNPSNYGQPVTFTATVAPQFGGNVEGTVSFYDGNTLLQRSVRIAGGTASLMISTLASGVHTITARYNGSAGLLPSSAGFKQTVN